MDANDSSLFFETVLTFHENENRHRR